MFACIVSFECIDFFSEIFLEDSMQQGLKAKNYGAWTVRMF